MESRPKLTISRPPVQVGNGPQRCATQAPPPRVVDGGVHLRLRPRRQPQLRVWQLLVQPQEP